jgi:predicted RNA-binding Zn-ribbon protein involved in translation (DUF1610 family)
MLPAKGCQKTMSDDDLNEVCFQCPDCGHDLRQSVGDLKLGKHMTCTGCGVGINIDSDHLATAADEIRKALDKVPPEITVKFFQTR